MGKHMYWYNWSNGVSQWEKPDDVKNLTDSQLGHRVMPATPKGGGEKSGTSVSAPIVDKAAELWQSLRERSKVVQQWSTWREFQDERTSELFYYNSKDHGYQWDKPTGWSPSPPTSNIQEKWQMVTTPLGRSLYWINQETGESQWDRPVEMSGTNNSNSGSNQNIAMKLASTPKARNKDHAAKLWLVLAQRSTRVQVVGNWHEFYDPMTKETFYHNSNEDEYRWEVPSEFLNGANNGGNEKSEVTTEMEPMITPTVHHATASKSNQPLQIWEPVATPKGKHLYYWNKYVGLLSIFCSYEIFFNQLTSFCNFSIFEFIYNYLM